MYNAFAKYYDVLMDDVDYGGWAQYLLDMMTAELGPLRHEAPWHVLDAACGTGNLSIPLAAAGCKVTGADRSESMLQIAQEKARRAGKPIVFVRQALEEMATPRPVDCINCACDGVNYLWRDEDLTAFLREAHRNLRAGGLLLFDISSAHKLTQRLDGHCYGEDRESITYLWQNAMDGESGLLQMDLTFFAQEGDGRFSRYRETHFQRPYGTEEILAALERAGFFQTRAYAFKTRRPPGEEEERIQFLARKPT